MKHKDKTKEQLVNELVELRQRNAELERLETQHKRMEEALCKSEEKYRTLSNQLPIGIYRTTKEGKILHANPALASILEYESVEDFIKIKSVDVYVDPCERTKQLEQWKTSKGIVCNEIKFRTKKGRHIWVRDTGRVILDKNGEIDYIDGTIEDITERKRMEEALRKREQEFKALVENAPDVISRFDKEFRHLYINPAVERESGTPPEAIIGKTARDLGSPEDLVAKWHETIKSIFETGQEITIETKYPTPTGIKYYSNRLAPEFSKDGSVETVLNISRDITERKKAEEEKEKLQAQLVQSVKMAGIGTLASGIAHEFNNLLQIMMGNVEFAQRTKKPEDTKDALDIVIDTSDKVARIIEDLLTFSRPEAFKKELCDITEPIESVLSLIEERLKKHNIDVVRKYGRIPPVEMNKAEMQQVFLNMVTNAQDAMLPKGGKLEISVRKVKKNVEVSFTDTGKGIEKENLDKVFEPFYTTKGAVGGRSDILGTGLGLSVTYGIVRRHGGTIEVESKVGKGTAFTITLPVKEVKTKKRSEKKREVEKPEVLNILVVDDEEEICKMFEKWLSAEGHRVKSALTGRKAINLVKREYFDIVFLDIVMPGIPATEVLEKIKEILPKTRVVMITGKFIDKDLLKKLKQKGASEYLQKPFKLEDIKEVLKCPKISL